MRRQIVVDDNPARFWIRGDRPFDMLGVIQFVAGLLHGRGDHFARRHLETRDQRLRAMANVVHLPTLDLARTRRLGRRFRLEGLDARLFINANRVDPLFSPTVGGDGVRRADLIDLLLENRVVFLRAVEPVTVLVGLEFRCLLKNVRLVGRISRALSVV